MESKQAPQISVVVLPKSMGIGMLLVAIFGPLGMLYATVPGAIVMLIISVPLLFIVGLFTLGFGAIVVWPIVLVACAVWTAIAINKHNKKMLSGDLYR
jgi:hypothetical protein